MNGNGSEEGAWQPSDTDVAWMAIVLGRIQHGGVVAFPDTLLVYAVDQGEKTLMLMNPEILRFNSSRVTHERTKKTCKLIGYTVKEAPGDRHHFE